MTRAVLRGQLAKEFALPEHIGVDEKAFAKGHRYATLVCDLDQGTVQYVGEERKQESLATYFAAFTEQDCAHVAAVSMDMWQPYINAVRAVVPGADEKIVFDRFHIMQHVLGALDRVRRAENKALRAEGDQRLVSTKYLWLRSQENLTEAAAKLLWLALRNVMARWSRAARQWTAALNQFALLYPDRFTRQAA